MQKIRACFQHKRMLSFPGAIGALAAGSLALAYIMLALGTTYLQDLHKVLWQSRFLTLFLNGLPLFLLGTFLLFLWGQAALALSVVSFLGLAMAIVNHVKLNLRGDPLQYRDLALYKEAVGISGSMGMGTILTILLPLLLVILLSILLCTKVKTAKIPVTRRIGGGAVTLLLLALSATTLYQSPGIYSRLPVVGSFYNLTNVHAAKGNLYCFLYDFFTAQPQRPPDYSRSGTLLDIAALPKNEENPPDTRPHILMIMGEAFSDLSDSEALSFEGFRDPLLYFKALGDEGITGHIIVPNRGGGTADTEFDVLTACASRYFRRVPYGYRMIAGKKEGLPSILRKAGYVNFALHPGFRWFYNRQNVYGFLGFDRVVFEDDFPREAYRGSFITEAATYEKLYALLEESRGAHPDQPIFGFCVTIENHGLYTNRFLPEDTYNFATDAPLSDAYRNSLSNYFEGVIRGDEELGRLAAHLDTWEEPALLIYFGDHLPTLEEELYDILLPPQADDILEELRLHKTPFLIWGNKALREKPDVWEQAAEMAMPDGQLMSSNYLGAYVLELLGFEGLSPFFDYANEVRGHFPILLEEDALYIDEKTPPEEAQSLLSLYRRWMYYRMADS